MSGMQLQKGKRWWLILPALVLPALIMATYSKGGTAETMQTIYRENTVTRGDITVGVTETATATLKACTLTFDIGATLEAIHVRAGQTVKAGEIVAVISAESIQEALSDVMADYQEAVYELSEAQLARQKGELDALTSYQNTIISSQFADETYAMAVGRLERAVTAAESALTEIQTEIRTYNRLLKYVDNYDSAEDYYANTKEIYEYELAYTATVKQALDQYRADALVENPNWDGTQEEYLELVEQYEKALEDLAYAKLEYEDTADEYDYRYDPGYQDEDTIVAARKKAYLKLADAEAEVEQAKYSLNMQTQQAGVTRQGSVNKAQIADTTYQMELAKLTNNVTSKQQLVDNYTEQIGKYNTYLATRELASPCNGVVTAVNFSAGDEFNPGSALVSIADSDNVYVYLSVTQDDVTAISLDQRCSVSMDAFETVTFDAAVESITTSPMRSSSGSASYSITLKLQGDTSNLYEGMTGSATIVTRQQKDVLQVSFRSVYAGADGKSYVKVKNAEGNLVETPVKTGFSDGRNVEIISGLSEGDVVVVESQVRSA
jgi:HlyD family secretion protein